jgi:hypothetical protein
MDKKCNVRMNALRPGRVDLGGVGIVWVVDEWSREKWWRKVYGREDGCLGREIGRCTTKSGRVVCSRYMARLDCLCGAARKNQVTDVGTFREVKVSSACRN